MTKGFPPLCWCVCLAALAAGGAEIDELRRKAQSGDAEAQLALADGYLFGRERPVNPVLAAYWYRKAAEQGNAAAEYNLGCCCEHGWGVEKSLHRALRHFAKAGEQGVAPALTRRAKLLAAGVPAEDLGEERFEELKPDRATALELLIRAARMDHAPAKFALAMLRYRHPEERRTHAAEIGELARQAAAAPDASPEMLVFFARCLQYGIGIAPNPARAAELLERAAEQGDGAAMSALGHMLEFGMGVKADPDRAAELYRRAAEQGDGAGMTRHGDRLLNSGELAAAYEWYSKAAKAEYPPACAKAGDCLANGWGVEADPAAAAKSYEQGARLGDPDSEFKLARCFAEGRGVEADPAAAVFWYKCAVAAGNRDAVRELGKALLHGTGVAADPAEGRRLLEAAARAGDSRAAAILQGE